jgi:hypothetical protein
MDQDRGQIIEHWLPVRTGSHLIRPSEINNKKGPDYLPSIFIAAGR